MIGMGEKIVDIDTYDRSLKYIMIHTFSTWL
jgi:hypothetical protein